MLVSVIIPCFNVEPYIQECVESVIGQSYRHIEIICVDNNSTDGTADALLTLKKKYSYLILEKESKPGAGAARNKGLSIAQGEWIQFLDADDLLCKTKIEHQVKLIRGTSNAFVAGAWKKRNLKGLEKEIIQFNSNIFVAVFTSQSGNTCSNLWNKQALDSINGWNEQLKSSQEADLMMRMVLENNQFVIDDAALTIVRARESGQISQQNAADNLERFIKIRLIYLNELELKFPEIFVKIKNELYSYLLPFVINLYHSKPNETLEIFNNQIKSKLQINLIYKKASLLKLIGLKLFMQLQKQRIQR